MSDDELNSILALHCGRFEDEALLANVRAAARDIASAAALEERERCASLVDPKPPFLSPSDHEWLALEKAANSIREL